MDPIIISSEREVLAFSQRLRLPSSGITARVRSSTFLARWAACGTHTNFSAENGQNGGRLTQEELRVPLPLQ